jgi:hypothetical protein
MKKLHLILLLPVVLLLFVSCEKDLKDTESLSQELQVRSTSTFHENYEYTNIEDVFSPCTNEFIHIEAVHKVTLNIVYNGNGGAHLSMHDHVPQASATGVTTGWEYIINYNSNETQNVKVGNDFPSTLNFHFVSKSHVPGIGQTGGYKVSYKVTINGQGQVIIDAFNFEYIC